MRKFPTARHPENYAPPGMTKKVSVMLNAIQHLIGKRLRVKPAMTTTEPAMTGWKSPHFNPAKAKFSVAGWENGVFNPAGRKRKSIGGIILRPNPSGHSEAAAVVKTDAQKL